MYRVSGTSVVVVGLCLMLGAAPSFAGPPNNDVSDAGRNTAGGSSALSNNIFGVDNTAVGFLALTNNTAGSSNTAFGKSALRFNTGSFNTAVGVAALGHNSSGSHDNTAGWFQCALEQRNRPRQHRQR